MKYSLGDTFSIVFFRVNLRKYFTATEAVTAIYFLREYARTENKNKMALAEMALFMDDYLKEREKNRL